MEISNFEFRIYRRAEAAKNFGACDPRLDATENLSSWAGRAMYVIVSRSQDLGSSLPHNHVRGNSRDGRRQKSASPTGSAHPKFRNVRSFGLPGILSGSATIEDRAEIGSALPNIGLGHEDGTAVP